MNKNVASKRPQELSRRLRLLYLDFNVGYMNPTRNLLPEALAKASDLTIFGPGHSTPEEVEAGPYVFAERHGPFDAVMGNEFSLLRPGLSEEELRGYSFKSHACRFNPTWRWKGSDYFTFIKEFSGHRFLSLFQLDYYNLTEDLIGMLEEISDYYICLGQEFHPQKPVLLPDNLLSHGMNRHIFERWNNNYYNFIRRNEACILSTPHFVDLTTPYSAPLEQRPCPWSVLGSDYDARVKSKLMLDEADIKRAGGWLPYIYALASKLGFNLYSRYWTIGLLNKLFETAMRRSRYSFTCGSVLHWPIRKFFEIPANGCVLVTDGCNGFEALGFKDRKNAIACDPKDILSVHAWLEENPALAQTIADAGRSLIAEQHTIEARARQLKESFLHIQEDRFHGSYWAEGKLQFRTPSRVKMASSEC